MPLLPGLNGTYTGDSDPAPFLELLKHGFMFLLPQVGMKHKSPALQNQEWLLAMLGTIEQSGFEGHEAAVKIATQCLVHRRLHRLNRLPGLDLAVNPAFQHGR